MAAPKFKPANLGRLYAAHPEADGKDQTLHDKKLIEALKERLNERLKNPLEARKAAIILESWINTKKNK
jgi:hypothetical protein